MRFPTLDAWLRWQETLHPSEIELGLDRVAAVFERLRPELGQGRFPCPVITVAGTNGKGSSVAMLEAVLSAAGYRVGAYTSPHLLRYNERVRIAGHDANDEALCTAFERIDAVRGRTSLTYFEFGTLAALDIFVDAGLDAVVLEVGMGGRLDAVNIVDPDVALITAIDIDHTQWLGTNRDTIAREKAGILRPGRPGIYSGRELPIGLAQAASQVGDGRGAPLYVLGRDFGHKARGEGWSWTAGQQRHEALPLPALGADHQLDNAAGVLMALVCLEARLPVGRSAVEAGLKAARLPGRFQVVPGAVTWILDVAHNPAAANVLARRLASQPAGGVTRAVVGMLADKDHSGVFGPLLGQIEHWYLADLHDSRGTPASRLAGSLGDLFARPGGAAPVACFDHVSKACAAAGRDARPGDRIVVFGSFHTVAEAVQAGLQQAYNEP